MIPKSEIFRFLAPKNCFWVLGENKIFCATGTIKWRLMVLNKRVSDKNRFIKDYLKESHKTYFVLEQKKKITFFSSSKILTGCQKHKSTGY